jgi:hypothetical protein
MEKAINKLLIVIIMVSLFSCDKLFQKPSVDLSDGINIVIGETNVIHANDIDFYDRSSHIIYFKENLDLNSFWLFGSKYWFIDNKDVFYEGLFDMTSGPCCECPTEYLTFEDWAKPAFLMEFKFYKYPISQFFTIQDTRENKQIFDVFEKYGKLRNGLSSEIVDVAIKNQNDVDLTIRVINNDTINYYYPDPEKMSIEMFHYYTFGLQLYKDDSILFQNNVKRQAPDPYGKLDTGWLTKIEEGTTKTYTIHYTSFDSLTSGNYLAIFTFPGLNYNTLSRSQIELKDGRIWIGDIELGKETESSF